MKTMTAKELMAATFKPEPITRDMVEELERLSALSDPGPWKSCMDLEGVGGEYGPEDGIQFGGEADFGGLSLKFEATPYDKAATVRLICAMRNALPGLLEVAKQGGLNDGTDDEVIPCGAPCLAQEAVLGAARGFSRAAVGILDDLARDVKADASGRAK